MSASLIADGPNYALAISTDYSGVYCVSIRWSLGNYLGPDPGTYSFTFDEDRGAMASIGTVAISEMNATAVGGGTVYYNSGVSAGLYETFIAYSTANDGIYSPYAHKNMYLWLTNTESNYIFPQSGQYTDYTYRIDIMINFMRPTLLYDASA